MADLGTGRPRPNGRTVDHPRPLGPLADVLAQRNIAVGVGPDGHVLLVRPDSVLFERPGDESGRGRLERFLGERRLGTDATAAPPQGSRRASFRVDIGRRDVGRINRERRHSLERAAGLVAEARAAGLRAEFNHVIIGAQTIKGNPLGASAWWAGEMAFVGDMHVDRDSQTACLLTTAEPTVPPQHWREPLDLDGRPRPRVLILDTGLRTRAAEALRAGGGSPERQAEHHNLQRVRPRTPWRTSDVSGDVDDEDEEFDAPAVTLATDGSATASSSRVLDFEAGHGTFIAGVVLQHCPDAEVMSVGVLSSFGDGDVEGLLAVLEDAIARQGPFDLVVMSFGTNLEDDEAGVFGDDLMRLLGDSLGVAAAGNQSTCRPYFPAALPGVIGVGALGADGKAWFTNFGGWVDACAPGVDVVSTFFENFDEVLDGETTRQYRGWVRWSGTSFSAPKVAAAIAQEQYLFGGTAKEAWRRITSHKHFRYPDLGIVFNL